MDNFIDKYKEFHGKNKSETFYFLGVVGLLIGLALFFVMVKSRLDLIEEFYFLDENEAIAKIRSIVLVVDLTLVLALAGFIYSLLDLFAIESERNYLFKIVSALGFFLTTYSFTYFSTIFSTVKKMAKSSDYIFGGFEKALTKINMIGPKISVTIIALLVLSLALYLIISFRNKKSIVIKEVV